MILSFSAISAMMVERIPQHRHCQACGKAFTGRDDFCSEDCREERSDEIKGKRKQLLILYALAVAVLVIALVVGL